MNKILFLAIVFLNLSNFAGEKKVLDAKNKNIKNLETIGLALAGAFCAYKGIKWFGTYWKQNANLQISETYRDKDGSYVIKPLAYAVKSLFYQDTDTTSLGSKRFYFAVAGKSLLKAAFWIGSSIGCFYKAKTKLENK